MKVDEGSDRQHPRALNRLDWIAVSLIAMTLLIAPLLAGAFPTPPQQILLSREGALSYLSHLGQPLVLFLTAAAYLVVAWRESKRPVAIGLVPGLTGACALLAVWSAITLLHTRSLLFSLNCLTALLAVLMLGGLISRLSRDRRGWTLLLLSVIGAGSFAAGLGTREYLEYMKSGAVHHRVFSTFVNPDFLAGYLLLTFPITVAAFSQARERLAKFSIGVGLALQSACLLMTGSRAGVIVMALALFTWLVLSIYTEAAAGRWKGMAAALAVVLVSALLGSAPLFSRVVDVTGPAADSGTMNTGQVASNTQGYSGDFRRWTWTGTVRMAKANPLLGTGIGTFEVAYPRYAETAYTAHAHNSYLQWTAETGVPGLLFLLSTLAAATAFAAHILLLQRRQTKEQNLRSVTEEREGDAAHKSAPTAAGPVAIEDIFAAPGILLSGLLASVLASLLHSLFDSDWFVTASAVTLAAVLALLVALARDLAPLATQKPRALGREFTAVGIVVAVLLLWRAGAVGVDKLYMVSAAEAASPEAAIDAYKAAAVADPADPEPHLHLALVYQSLNRVNEARDELKSAVRIAPSGKALYRLGQFYAVTGDTGNAIAVFERGRETEPRNVQLLHALAKTYQAAGKLDQAISVYREITALEDSPYGKVRAFPELVETDFAFAHAELGNMALTAGKLAEAEKEYGRAVNVLREFWSRRKLDVTFMRPREKREEATRLYESCLARWQECLQKQGKSEEAARAAGELSQFHQDLQDDQEAQRKAQQQEGSAQ
jgi:O-antigen ligase